MQTDIIYIYIYIYTYTNTGRRPPQTRTSIRHKQRTMCLTKLNIIMSS